MVFDVIPFYEVKSIWIGKSNEGKCLEIEDVKRAYSRCVENEICPGFVGSSQESAIIFLQNIAKVIEESPETEAGADNLRYIREMVDRACKLFRGGAREELETLTNDIRDEISKTIILNDETWEGLRCRICPSCTTAIPTYFCICLECVAQLISTGRFCVNIDSDDDDDHKPNVSGDARRAQEEANDNAAAQEKGGGMEDDPEDDDMGTQEETSGYVSEEEDNAWNYRDNDMAARDIINSQRMAICMDEPREAQYQGCGGCSRLARREQMMPRSKGLPRVHTTITWDTIPTLRRTIEMVPFYHPLNIRFLNLIMFGQGPTGRSESARNTFIIWRSNVRGCTFSTNCGLQQRSSTSPGMK